MTPRDVTRVYHGGISLIGVSGFYDGRALRLRRGECIVLGRDRKACALLYPQTHAHVSAMHCRIDVDASGCVHLTDLHSMNGTFSKNQRLTPNRAYPLANGDEFALCDTERFRVHID